MFLRSLKKFVEIEEVCKTSLKSLYLTLGANTKCGPFLKILYYVPFHHENISTKRTMASWFIWITMWKRHGRHCFVICVENISTKNGESQSTEQKSTLFVLLLSLRYQDLNIFKKIKKILETPWASIITTSPIKLLKIGP